MGASSQDENAAGGPSPAASLSDPEQRTDPPVWQVTLWPNRSLSASGRRTVLAVTAGCLALMLVPFLHHLPFVLMLAPFLAAALAGLWLAFRRNNRDGRLTETLRLWPDLMAVERREPSGAVLRWQANPYWIEVRLHADARLENYLTLKGGGREIELGAFLAPEERAQLCDDIRAALRNVLRQQ